MEALIIHLAILGTLVSWAWWLFVFYLAYVTLLKAKGNGKLKAAPLLPRLVAYSVIVCGAIVDVGFNFLIASFAFLELPSFRRPTFTQRCEYHLQRQGWRGDLARWICYGWLNPFDDHCKEGT